MAKLKEGDVKQCLKMDSNPSGSSWGSSWDFSQIHDTDSALSEAGYASADSSAAASASSYSTASSYSSYTTPNEEGVSSFSSLPEASKEGGSSFSSLPEASKQGSYSSIFGPEESDKEVSKDGPSKKWIPLRERLYSSRIYTQVLLSPTLASQVGKATASQVELCDVRPKRTAFELWQAAQQGPPESGDSDREDDFPPGFVHPYLKWRWDTILGPLMRDFWFQKELKDRMRWEEEMVEFLKDYELDKAAREKKTKEKEEFWVSFIEWEKNALGDGSIYKDYIVQPGGGIVKSPGAADSPTKERKRKRSITVPGCICSPKKRRYVEADTSESE